MKKAVSERSIPYLLGLIIFLVLSLVLLIKQGGTSVSTTDLNPNNAPIPISNGAFTHAGDIQGAATGLQNAAPLAPTQLDQLQVSR